MHDWFRKSSYNLSCLKVAVVRRCRFAHVAMESYAGVCVRWSCGFNYVISMPVLEYD